MELLGHRTRSIFDRYNITSDSDLREGLAKVRAATAAGAAEKKEGES
jgi:hypothetical protein